MSKVNNLSQGDFKALLQRVRRLELAAPLSNSSIGRGQMRFYDGSVLLIENGALRVTGTATITGTLIASGTIDFTGTLTQSGPSTFTGKTDVAGAFTVTGPTKLNGVTEIGGNTKVTGDLDVVGPLVVTGPTELNGVTKIGGNTTVTGKLDVTGPMATKGTLSVEGISTLRSDLNVVSGGKIKVGGTTIDPTQGDGAVQFATGGKLVGAVGGASLQSGASALTIALGMAALGNSSRSIQIEEGGEMRLVGLPGTSNAPNLYRNPSTGVLYQCT